MLLTTTKRAVDHRHSSQQPASSQPAAAAAATRASLAGLLNGEPCPRHGTLHHCDRPPHTLYVVVNGIDVGLAVVYVHLSLACSTDLIAQHGYASSRWTAPERRWLVSGGGVVIIRRCWGGARARGP